MSRQIAQSVVVTIRINNAGQVGNQVEAIGQRGQRAFGGWRSSLATVEKALISMVGVLTAWTLFITIPEKLASAFKDLAMVSLSAAAEMERSFLALAGLLASFQDFGGANIEENFATAVVQSEKLLLQFQLISAESLGSATDLLLAYQTLVTRGGLAFVKTQEESLQLTRLLTDTVLALTGGQAKERQIVSEISALMEGQARSGALLAKIVKAQVGDLQAWVQQQRTAGTLLQSLQKMFGGMNEASGHLANTMEGVLNSIKGQLSAFNVFINRVGALQMVMNWLKQIRDILRSALEDLLKSDASMTNLKKETEDVLRIFGYLNASIEQALIMFKSLISSISGANTPLQQSVNLAEDLAGIMVAIRVVVDFIVDGFKGFLAMAKVGVLSLTSITAEVLNLTPAAALLDTAQIAEDNKEALREAFKDMKEEFTRQSKILPFNELMVLEMEKMQQSVRISIDNLKKQFLGLSNTPALLGEALNAQAVDEEVVKLMERLQKKVQDLGAELRSMGGVGGAFANAFREVNREMTDFNQEFGTLWNTAKFEEGTAQILQKYYNEFFKAVEDFRLKNSQTLADELAKNSAMNAEVAADAWLREWAAVHDAVTAQIDVLQIVNQESDSFAHRLEMLRTRGGSFQQVVSLITIQTREMSLQLSNAERQLAALDATGKLSLADFQKLTAEIERLNRAIIAMPDPILEMMEQLKAAAHSIGDIFAGIVLQITLFNQSLKDAILNNLPVFATALSKIEQAFSSLTDGIESTVPLLKRFAGAVIGVFADIISALGRYFAAMAVGHFLVGDVGKGAAYAAAAAGAFAAAGLLRGWAQSMASGNKSTVGGAASTASASGDRRVIQFQPVNNFETIRDLRDAVVGLNKTVANLKGISPGDVVTMGAPDASYAISIATVGEIHKSNRIRTDFASAVGGEA